MFNNSQSFKSEHFSIEPLAEGVYGAVHREGGWAIANAGIVDLGDGCLVFDTFLTPAAGADLRRAAEGLTGQPVRYLVNSHYHNDHIWGNQAFDPETAILSSAETRRLIESKGRQEYDWYFEHSAARLAELKAQFTQAGDEEERASIQFSLLYYQALAASMPELELRLPTQTFESEFSLQGSNAAVELLSFERAHTGHDTILHLASSGIIFTADLLFVGCHPFLPDGEVAGLLAALAAIKQLEPEVLLPGHGPVGSPEDLDIMIQYLHDLKALARQLAPEVDLTQEPTFEPPAQYAAWDYPPFFQANMNYLVRQAQAEA
jgi:glyoxylase-like metal-dependent hydrolase (beta-lactamase superfamily II)